MPASIISYWHVMNVTLIWRGEPPISVLQVAADMGEGLSHLVVLNSLSKRSNAAGLRAGFLAGDEAAITLYKKFGR